MRSVRGLLVLCLLAAVVGGVPARAGTLSCPELGNATPVGACPSEEELQFTFTGYCSDNARIYNWQEDTVCTNYALYRKLKNVVLWETPGGDFQGYLSCDIPAEKVKAAKPVSVEVSRLGRMTRVACAYGEGITFAHRTRASCKVEGEASCAGSAAGCKATCE